MFSLTNKTIFSSCISFSSLISNKVAVISDLNILHYYRLYDFFSLNVYTLYVRMNLIIGITYGGLNAKQKSEQILVVRILCPGWLTCGMLPCNLALFKIEIWLLLDLNLSIKTFFLTIPPPPPKKNPHTIKQE